MRSINKFEVKASLQHANYCSLHLLQTMFYKQSSKTGEIKFRGERKATTAILCASKVNLVTQSQFYL